MRVLMLSWEYPPRIIGGLGRHVWRLATALADQGHDVHVVSREHPDAVSTEVLEGVHVVRAGDYPPEIAFRDLLPWVLQFNNSVQHQAVKLLLEHDFDVIHAHDWLVAYAAAALKDIFGIPLVSTMHATEHGRNQGRLTRKISKTIHQVESWLTDESQQLIACSAFMRDEVCEIFEAPREKVEVIPNGVDLGSFEPQVDEAFRSSLVTGDEKLVFFAGRLVHEKGVQTILDALPSVQRKIPVRLLIAGTGPHERTLRAHVRRAGLGEHVEFLGFVPDDELRRYYAVADLGVVPSIYEPFGMVALETMAAGTPCIAADTGGLREIVVHDATGLRFTPEDPHSLARTMLRILGDARLARRLTLDARLMLEQEFSWRSIARRTVGVYERAIAGERHAEPPRPLRAIGAEKR